jgi:3'(2'), 5'-bisphosphate nucleotidase
MDGARHTGQNRAHPLTRPETRPLPATSTVPFDSTDPELLDRAIEIARAAGAAIMPFYRSGTAVRAKADASPVTAADEAADALISAALRELTPAIPCVSEESAGPFGGKAPARVFWLVDPLDGTREFVAGRDEFTVNIALVTDTAPVLGVVYLPARNELYAGAAGRGAVLASGGKQRPIRCRPLPAAGAIVAVSRSHGDRAADSALLGGLKVAGEVCAGSALKFCLIARGDADVYPRAGRTMEWDTAAGQAVLVAAGGCVVDRNGLPLTYGKPGFENPSFVARGPIAQSGKDRDRE